MRHALSDREYQALARFRHALRVFLHFSEQAARDAGVAPAQHQLLLAIRGHAGPRRRSSAIWPKRSSSGTTPSVELVDRAEAAGS